jgi:hypothetical protein
MFSSVRLQLPSLSACAKIDCGFLLCAVVSLMGLAGLAGAQTISSGGAINITGPTGSGSSTVTVSGATGSVKTVQVLLSGVTSSGYAGVVPPADSDSIFYAALVLEGPGGQKFELLGCT